MRYISEKLNIDTDDVFAKVLGLRSHWIKRLDAPFYTLGRCAYQDKNSEEYRQGIKETNVILFNTFQKLYEEVGNFLSDLLKEPIHLNENLAFPSFHIAESCQEFVCKGGDWHQDHPHITMGLGDTDPLTFTVAIKLPASGAGMDYLDKDGVEQSISYFEGGIIIHDGKTLHKIQPLKEYVPGEYRITFQGHLIRINGRLTMFW